MRNYEKQLVSLILAGAQVPGGCMPTQSKETAAVRLRPRIQRRRKTQQEQTRKQPWGADTEAAAPADMEVNTTDPITLRFNWWGGDSPKKTLKAITEAFEAKYPNITGRRSTRLLTAMRRRYPGP